ncbi:MAG: hypothetical protein GX051_07535 [Clostridiales bacterium]|nr:hypothetical protein [Clostridiales bacterium]
MKKSFKKCLSLILTLVLSLCMLAIPVAATAETPEVSVSSSFEVCGEIMRVNINLKNFEGIKEGKIALLYNPDALLPYTLPQGAVSDLPSDAPYPVPFEVAPEGGKLTVLRTCVPGSDAVVLFNVSAVASDLNLECELSGFKDAAGNDAGSINLDTDFGLNKSFARDNPDIPFVGFIESGDGFEISDNVVYSVKACTVGEFLSKLQRGNAKVHDAEGREMASNEKMRTGVKVSSYYNNHLVEKLSYILMGDVDCDGAVTAADARLALRIATGLEKVSAGQLSAANVSRQANASPYTPGAADARDILRHCTLATDNSAWLHNHPPYFTEM